MRRTINVLQENPQKEIGEQISVSYKMLNMKKHNIFNITVVRVV